MDFDPHSVKWQCCCCSLPSGLQVLATAEMLLSTIIAGITTYHLSQSSQNPSWFEATLIIVMIIMATTSALLIFAVHRHIPTMMYPSLFARGVLIIFVQAFGVSTVVSPHEDNAPIKPAFATTQTPPVAGPQMALRLVLLVFAMLFLTILLFYCIYLVVRGIRYESSYARLKQRRASLIQAGMIDPDFGSRRPSNA